jgi:capsular exopolysaccharide synthesis family protein
MARKKMHSSRKLYVVSKSAPFQFVEAYKSLRTNLEFLSATNHCKTILITSSVPGEGKSNVAINLAATLAASGKKVVLVDGDMRKSSLSHYLHIPHGHLGFTSIIAGQKSLTDCLVLYKDLNIVALPVGPIPPNPSELLSAPVVDEVFASLQKTFDYVIVDTPPVSVVTDAAVLCRLADGVILVVRPEVSTIQSTQLSKKNLEAVNAHFLGVVLNGYNAKKAGKKDGYYYSYNYGYYNREEAADAGDKAEQSR